MKDIITNWEYILKYKEIFKFILYYGNVIDIGNIFNTIEKFWELFGCLAIWEC